MRSSEVWAGLDGSLFFFGGGGVWINFGWVGLAEIGLGNTDTHSSGFLRGFTEFHRVFLGWQGLNYVAGLLLLATKDEEQSFWLLTVLIRNILPNYHTRTMDGLITDTTVLAELIRIKSPQVFPLSLSLSLSVELTLSLR